MNSVGSCGGRARLPPPWAEGPFPWCSVPSTFFQLLLDSAPSQAPGLRREGNGESGEGEQAVSGPQKLPPAVSTPPPLDREHDWEPEKRQLLP